MPRKHVEGLFCKIGEVVRFTNELVTTPWPDEQPVKVARGARYRVVGLVDSGWDLERESGDGPFQIRILNSEMPLFVEIANAPSE
jgi:hypothetical protein